MHRFHAAACLAVILAFVPGRFALADEGCKLYPQGSVIDWHYDFVGPEACLAACEATEGCVAWSYAPHNFNPGTAPGECRLLPDAGTREDHPRDFCGQRGG